MKIIKAATVFLTAFLLTVLPAIAQKVYTVEASQAFSRVSKPFKLGNTGPAGKEILVNDRYLTIGGKVVLPVMGEIHYARVPQANWEDAILKMKANGITIIATYIFWIHHEEIEGEFNWKGNKDLRAFIQLCQQHGLYVYPRLGPWCHGEVRNGGTPDWVLLKKAIRVRSNDVQYQQYVDRWFGQIGKQLARLTYKDGGPIIGVQLENEYVEGAPGEDHIRWLKKTAVKYGLDVPLYTVTGWGNASIPTNEVIPLFGAYPDEPWMDDLERSTSCTNFGFSAIRNDANIGNELQQAQNAKQLAIYPYFTCEIGVGIDNTAHRRLVIDGIDGYGLITAKLGSGSNLLGYYMFAGGLNPTGSLTSMEENSLESGGYNTNPAVAYDFQAAIRTSGALSPSYHEIKKTHYFLNEFGSLLAPMEPVFVATGDDLRLSLRAKDNQAFLFGLNYCRHTPRKEIREAQFTVKLKSETLTFPSQPVAIPDSSMLMWPINFPMGSTLLKYATAQPLCQLNNQWVFIQSFQNEPEFCFDAAGIKTLTSNTGKVVKRDGKYIISHLQPGYNAVIRIQPSAGPLQHVLILSQAGARQAWLLTQNNKKYFYLSNANMYLNGGKLHVYGTQNAVMIRSLGSENLRPDSKLPISSKKQGLFKTYTYELPPQKVTVASTRQPVLANAQWLVVNQLEQLTKKQVLRHHFFTKEFDLVFPSRIKSAKLILFTQSEGRVQANTVWVNQPVAANQLTEMDLTGYVQKGKNRLLLEFPFAEGRNTFAAKLVVESYDNRRMELSTDTTWRSGEGYTFPSHLTGGYPSDIPEVALPPADLNVSLSDYQQYVLTVPATYPKSLSNVYVNIYYSGDGARLYAKERLMDDHFNNHTHWSIGLNRYGSQFAGQEWKMLLYPLKKNARVYFDRPNTQGEDASPVIHTIQVLPEYQADFSYE